MGAWAVNIKVTDCATGTPIPAVAVDSPWEPQKLTDVNGQTIVAADADFEAFEVLLRHADYVYRYQSIQRSDGGTVSVCMKRGATPREAMKPTGLHVVEGSTDHVTLRWTNPQSYSKVHAGWSQPGGTHHQLNDRPGGTTTETIRATFTPGVEYSFGVQGRVDFADPPWSGWASVRWRCPRPGAAGTAWFQDNWEELGDTFLATLPAAVSWGPERIDVFHGVYQNVKQLGHRWHQAGWAYEAMEVAGPGDVYGFAAASRRSGWLDVFYVSERRVWQVVHDGTRWHAPEDIGGPPVRPGTTLAAVSWGGDRLDLFYAGPDGQLIQRYRGDDDNPWSGEVVLPGQVKGRPTVASWGPNRLDVFYSGPDSALHQTWWDGHRWSTANLGGAVKRDIVAAVSWGGDRLDVFYQGQGNDRLFQRFHQNRGWSGEIDLGPLADLGDGPVVNISGLSVASWAPGRLDLFYCSLPGTLWHHWYGG